MLDAYLLAPQSNAVRNIILAGRALHIEDDLIIQMMSSFEKYQRDCHVNSQALEAADITPFLRVYEALSSRLKQNIAQDFLK